MLIILEKCSRGKLLVKRPLVRFADMQKSQKSHKERPPRREFGNWRGLLLRASTEQPSFLEGLLLDHADIISRTTDSGCNELRVQLCFRDDHCLTFRTGRTNLFHRTSFAYGIVDMGLAHSAHHSVDFYCILPHGFSSFLNSARSNCVRIS